MASDQITYRASRVKCGMMLAAIVLFVYGSYQFLQENVWIGIVGIILSGVVGALLLMYFVDPMRYTITANQLGVEMRYAFRVYTIPWSDIDFFFIGSRNTVTVAYKVTASKQPMTSMLALFNAPAQTIVNSLNNYRERHANSI